MMGVTSGGLPRAHCSGIYAVSQHPKIGGAQSVQKGSAGAAGSGNDGLNDWDDNAQDEGGNPKASSCLDALKVQAIVVAALALYTMVQAIDIVAYFATLEVVPYSGRVHAVCVMGSSKQLVDVDPLQATVLVTTTLMKEYRARFGDDRGPLAYILAHEIAHVLAKHTADQVLITSTQVSIGKDDPIIALELRRMPDSLNDAQKANALRHKFEYEADELAAHLMAEVDYDPRDALRGLAFLAKIQDKYTGKGGLANEYDSTHPPIHKRMQHLHKNKQAIKETYKRAEREAKKEETAEGASTKGSA
ncbi:hypothetical protein GPECTOR_10g810 [Gonium pectorale]|uniref:Peptidase M48 domain-containing protein n=1 Tax=Gonium pectorale TaxID=33097 RepID=A0A150GQV0_GONPE|nr:hypothetical protein GPECTOR_10g810 [Gonium pectorale]|eukprot:KXZ52181.1 hypothetical protein GPECTOR_10g810 [Gonium pectorale]